MPLLKQVVIPLNDCNIIDNPKPMSTKFQGQLAASVRTRGAFHRLRRRGKSGKICRCGQEWCTQHPWRFTREVKSIPARWQFDRVKAALRLRQNGPAAVGRPALERHFRPRPLRSEPLYSTLPLRVSDSLAQKPFQFARRRGASRTVAGRCRLRPLGNRRVRGSDP